MSLSKKNIPAGITPKELASLQPIDSVPSIEVSSLNGQRWVIGKGSQKKTLVILFTTWCGTCKEALPALDAEFGKTAQPFQVLAIGRHHTEQALLQWQAQTQFRLPVIADSSAAVSSLFAPDLVPRFYIIDTTGNVLYQDIGWGNYMIEDFKKHLP
ncbi:MAG: TlpA family protein disulfide reductase [Cytophagaceae bacterium]|nr:TlpA family protein disulfide reductase [Cytophagaceae bacterium]